MKIYVAGKWEDREWIRFVQDELREKGHTITCDWTNHNSPHKYGDKYAIEHVDGLRECDIVIAVMTSKYPYGGVWADIGAALVLKKIVIVIGHGGDSEIFIKHPLVRKVETIDEAIEVVGRGE